MRPGTCTYEGRLRLAVFEENRRRNREHVVARCCDRVLVDVQLRELYAAAVLCLELLENRIDCFARPAPRRPEIQDDRRVRLQDISLERLVRDLEHALGE